MENNINDIFFNNINGYSLDLKQREIVLNNNQSLLVVAGAGSGKTLTIIAKIKYLIEKLHVKESEILCISFTNETVNSLKNKLNYNINIYTFHKLALEILKDNKVFFQLADNDLLEYITNEYFENDIYFNDHISLILYYFRYCLNNSKITYENVKKEYYKMFQDYKKLIIKFINMIKCNNHEIKDFKKYLKKNKYLINYQKKIKNKCFLLIMFDIYNIYLNELNSTYQIDFDMMIQKASLSVKEKGIKRYYKYIIIDEFQDTSLVRYNLIKNIIDECNAKLMCVGDDFQSIYRFSGCTLDLFVNFHKYFKKSTVMYMNNTYRNSYDLIKISYSFIIKNKYQYSKKLVSNKRLEKPIKIIYYTKSNYKYMFLKLLEKLKSENKKELLVLGRCNHDIFYVYDKIDNNGYLDYKELNIRYLTVHRSKGLEADNVIVLNLDDSMLGFPNKIADDEVLKLFFKNKEKYLYAEERRLFYVALTRTKNNVYLMTKTNNESCFVKEIIKKCEIIDI